MAIILLIIGLVAGYFFLTKFDKIDNALFGSIEGYIPFGITVVYISALFGAVFGCVFFYSEVAGGDVDLSKVNILICAYLGMMVCASVFQAFLYLDSAGAIIGKSLFMIVSCALAMIIGVVASIVVIFCLIVYLILVIIGKAAFGSSGRSSSSSSFGSGDSEERLTVIDEHGFERELRDEGFGSYRDDKGDRWKRSGWNTVTRDND